MAQPSADAPLRFTPLVDRHRAAGARMTAFAGYEMPVQYPTGIIAEHNWTRASAGVFDVSHMGQAMLIAEDGRHETAAAALEALVPADIAALAPGQQRYTQLLNAEGGIIDDLMAARPADAAEAGRIALVVNAGGKEADYAHIAANLPEGVRIAPAPERALIALQGPKAAEILAGRVADAAEMRFMTVRRSRFDGRVDIALSRSGYTGEDGYELSIPAARVGAVWDLLLADERVKPIGLGARDSLRLEAGLCLYGHDIDETTSPVEAGLAWSIQKRRRASGGFPGAARILRELREGPARMRVGFAFEGRAPAREGAEVRAEGRAIGRITSGGFAPSLNAPIAMGYLAAANARPGAAVEVMVRDRPLAARIVARPFAPHRYKR